MEMISLHPRTSIAAGPDGAVLVGHPWGVHTVHGDYLGLRRLVGAPVDPSTLDATELRFLATFPFLVVHWLGDALRLVPLGVDARPAEPAGDDVPVRLSRFAFFHSVDGRLVLESPLSLYRAELDPSLSFVASLATPRSIGSFSGLEQAVVRNLVSAGLLGGEDSPELRTWEFHDLLFHTRSRAGRHDNPVGGTYPHPDAEAPAIKPARPGPVIELPVPGERDVSFTAVLERRRSTRSYGERGMTLDELGELLHRAAWRGGRPYPSGGASYDLEVYLAVRRCEGLERGVYHYDALAHVLRLVNPDLGELARRPADFDDPPDVLLVITSRFRRVSWKYTSIAYATTLRNVGVLFQTLYLVASSMGLAACAIGSGDVAVTEKVLGLPFTEESTVGEFALGSLRV